MLYLIQSKLIFFPQPLIQSQVERYKDLELTFQRENVKLHGWFLKGEKEYPNKLIIYFGGNAEEVSGSFTELQNNTACSLLVMNYRGFGKSEGTPSQDSLFADSLYIFDQVVEENGFSKENIILFGRSLGSGIATYLASKRQVGRVILVTPFDSILSIARKRYFLLPVKLLLKHPFPSSEFAANINHPLLEIIATHDEVIPLTHSQALFDSWKGAKRIVEIQGANHQNISGFNNYWAEINDFISSSK